MRPPVLSLGRIFPIVRGALCYLLASCIVLGPAVVPSVIVCVESGGHVDIEPTNAACCSKPLPHFNGLGLGLHSCGDCADTALSLPLESPNSQSFSPALPAALLIVPISLRSDVALRLQDANLPLKKVRPPGIVLLC
jgi:hypothetical protein